jgi:MFS family permease
MTRRIVQPSSIRVHMSPARDSTIVRSTVIGLAALLTAMMPFATDVYLIVMPAIAAALGATQADVHHTMAVFALGFGVAHLFVGMLADRYGRRPGRDRRNAAVRAGVVCRDAG